MMVFWEIAFPRKNKNIIKYQKHTSHPDIIVTLLYEAKNIVWVAASALQEGCVLSIAVLHK